MSEAEIVYTSSEVYSRLGVSGSTLRKYSDVLEREGYDVRKNSRGRREYGCFCPSPRKGGIRKNRMFL
ncbi:hypothetical protein IIE_06137 [Bacillus cereus VD045]|nr:hypothetical protein IIE_06137 [Bacillus cereus VD045]